MEVLGFRINSITLNISLPLEVSDKRVSKLWKIHADIKIRELARLLGKLSASIQAVFRVPLHYRHIQGTKTTEY